MRLMFCSIKPNFFFKSVRRSGSASVRYSNSTCSKARYNFRIRSKTIDIVRRNAYFGDVTEAGVMFIGFSNNIDVTMGMLRQMYGVGPDGIAKTDALLDFSKAVSSSIYFVPSYDALVHAGITILDQP